VPLAAAQQMLKVAGTITINVTTGTTAPYTYSFNGVLLPQLMY
jgi:hypothetical protein